MIETKTVRLNGLDGSIETIGFVDPSRCCNLPDNKWEQRVRVSYAVANTLGRHDTLSWGVRFTGDTSHDMAVAVAMMRSIEVIPPGALRDHVFVGEVGLNGEIYPIHGVALAVRVAAASGARRIVVPRGNVEEALAAIPEGSSMEVLAPRSLQHLLDHLAGEVTIDVSKAPALRPTVTDTGSDMSEVFGYSPDVYRAISAAVAGDFGLVLEGLPGSGRTLLASRIPGIMPDLTEAETRRLTEVHSVAGLLRHPRLEQRPFRSPHYSISEAGMAGTKNRLGEIHLAAFGVLFLDELGEFKRHTLEYARATIQHQWPSDLVPPFVVVAMDPCPCAYESCVCPPDRVRAYQDRMALSVRAIYRDQRPVVRVRVPRIDLLDPRNQTPGPTSAEMREQIVAARSLAATRQRRIETSASLTQIAQTFADLEGANLLPRHHEQAEQFFYL